MFLRLVQGLCGLVCYVFWAGAMGYVFHLSAPPAGFASNLMVVALLIGGLCAFACAVVGLFAVGSRWFKEIELPDIEHRLFVYGLSLFLALLFQFISGGSWNAMGLFLVLSMFLSFVGALTLVSGAILKSRFFGMG